MPRSPMSAKRHPMAIEKLERLHFIVQGIPPSVNHYKTRFRNGCTVVSKEALAFKRDLAVECMGQSVSARLFTVTILIMLGKGDRGDVDNFPKLVLDGLAECGAFRSLKGKMLTDAYVRHLVVALDCDIRPPVGQTEITVEALR